jgi:hypothetical protein
MYLFYNIFTTLILFTLSKYPGSSFVLPLPLRKGTCIANHNLSSVFLPSACESILHLIFY